MIFAPKICFPALAVFALTACSEQVAPIEASRIDNTSLYFFNDEITTGPVREQVAALNEMADDLVKSSTVQGALIGVAMGCGLTALSGSNAQSCLTSAAVAGVGGAVLGNRAGEKDLARRVELVAADDIARDLNAANRQLASIRNDLPAFLASQEAELNRLTMQRINGEISQEEHDIAVLRIQGERIDLADALSLTARNARRASDNLRAAADRGQTDLDWHIGSADRLSADVQSTRSTFSLL